MSPAPMTVFNVVTLLWPAQVTISCVSVDHVAQVTTLRWPCVSGSYDHDVLLIWLAQVTI